MSTRVRFIEHGGRLSMLEIEGPPEHPLLQRLVQTLSDLGVRIIEHEDRRDTRRCVRRVLVSELDGSDISEGRRLQIQSALVTSASQPPPAKAP